LKGKRKILLDTSALLLFFEGVDVLDKLWHALQEPMEFYTLDTVIEELRELAKSPGSRRGRAARTVLTYVISKLKVIETHGKYQTADDAIVEFTKKHPEFIVVTLDEELRSRLKELNAKVLTWWASRKRFSKG